MGRPRSPWHQPSWEGTRANSTCNRRHPPRRRRIHSSPSRETRFCSIRISRCSRFGGPPRAGFSWRRPQCSGLGRPPTTNCGPVRKFRSQCSRSPGRLDGAGCRRLRRGTDSCRSRRTRSRPGRGGFGRRRKSGIATRSPKRRLDRRRKGRPYPRRSRKRARGRPPRGRSTASGGKRGGLPSRCARTRGDAY